MPFALPHLQLSMSSKWLVIIMSLVLVGPVTMARGDEEPKSASDAKDSKAATKTVKLSGVFEAITSSEIKVGTEHLGHLEIKRVLPHGTKVTKGQNVVWLDTEEIDKQIKKAEVDFRLAKLAMEDEEFAHKQFLETQSLDKAKAERVRKQAQQAYDNFTQVDRERQIKSAKQSLKSSRASLENAQEELKQLEQMYKEDDLTEESEEIVLKRTRETVEFAEYRLEGTEISTERTIKQTVPRLELQQKDTLDRAMMTYRKSIRDLESARQKHDIEITRKRDKFKEEEEKLSELQAERKKVVLQSANNGIVLHGKLTRGKMSDKPSTLKPESKVTADQVIATVVDPSRLQVRVTLAEKDLAVATVGTKCKIVPKAAPDHKINGTVKSVASFPYANGKYDCVVSFRKSKNQPSLLPTSGCDLQFEVPNDDSDDDKDAVGKK